MLSANSTLFTRCSSCSEDSFIDFLWIDPLMVGTMLALRFKCFPLLCPRHISEDAVWITFGEPVPKVASLISCSPVFFSFNFSARFSVMYVLCDPESNKSRIVSLLVLSGFLTSVVAVCMRTNSLDDIRAFSSRLLICSIKAFTSCVAKILLDCLNFFGHKLLWWALTSPQWTQTLLRLHSLARKPVFKYLKQLYFNLLSFLYGPIGWRFVAPMLFLAIPALIEIVFHWRLLCTGYKRLRRSDMHWVMSSRVWFYIRMDSVCFISTTLFMIIYWFVFCTECSIVWLRRFWYHFRLFACNYIITKCLNQFYCCPLIVCSVHNFKLNEHFLWQFNFHHTDKHILIDVLL